MEKTLNIEDMVKEYTSTTNEVARKMFMEKIQIEPYISYSSKIIYASRIIESTSWDPDNKRIEVNSPIRYILYVYTLLLLYTNIDVHNEGMLAEYDALASAGLVEKILDKIPEREKKEFDTVLKMVGDDYYTNHFETHAYIDSLIDRLRNIVENFLTPISEDIVSGLNKLDAGQFEKALADAVASQMNKGNTET